MPTDEEMPDEPATPKSDQSRGTVELKAALNKGHLFAANLLLQAGARFDPEMTEEDRKALFLPVIDGNKVERTVLQAAAQRGYDALVHHLLNLNGDASVSQEDELAYLNRGEVKSGYTALHYICC